MEYSSTIPEVSLEGILCGLDQYSTEQNRESLKFLARAFTSLDELERLPQESLCARIKQILFMLASTGVALDILQRMLVVAKYDPGRVAKLEQFVGYSTLSQSISPSSEIYSKLSFQELLLIISQKIDSTEDGEPVLQHLLEAVSEADIGSAKVEVKSALHLFTGMQTSGTLTPSDPSTLNSKLRKPLCTLRSKDEKVHKVIAEVVEVMDKNVHGKLCLGVYDQWTGLLDWSPQFTPTLVVA